MRARLNLFLVEFKLISIMLRPRPPEKLHDDVFWRKRDTFSQSAQGPSVKGAMSASTRAASG